MNWMEQRNKIFNEIYLKTFSENGFCLNSSETDVISSEICSVSLEMDAISDGFTLNPSETDVISCGFAFNPSGFNLENPVKIMEIQAR